LPASPDRAASAPLSPDRPGFDASAVAALRAADPVLRELIDEVGPDPLGDRRAGRPTDHYGALVRSIVGQQLSTRAAHAIYSRLTDRFGGGAKASPLLPRAVTG
jgi:3-methyladenine DNA glycosylase/8-oxoguanine DNA glycosylase